MLRLYKSRLLIEEWSKPFFQVSVPWLVGLFIGAFVAFHLSDNQLQIVRVIASRKAPLFGVLFSSFIPFLIVAFIARFMGHRCLQTYLFIKSALLTLCFCYCNRCFGTSGWLVTTLLFFTDLISSYYLVLFSFQLFTSKTERSALLFVLYSVISILLGLFNYFILSPFTASLF